MSSNDVLLAVEDLHTWFEIRRFGFFRVGYVRAVDGVSFVLRRGEAVAVVGESGCGKSTLARTVLGLYTPTRGRIVFDGKTLDAKDDRAMRAYRAQVVYVPLVTIGALQPVIDVRSFSV